MVSTYPIQSLSIQGFQSIQDLDSFELNTCNVLIGANGTGKSNLISYFRMLGELVEQRLQGWVAKQGGAERLLTFGIKETPQLKSQLQFGENGYRFTLEPTEDGGFVFMEESLLFRGKNAVLVGAGYLESRLKNEIVPHQWRRADYCYASISSWKVYHFHDTSDTAGMKRWGSLSDKAYLRPDASNLAAFLYHLRQAHPSTYQEILEAVKLALPFFDDFILETRNTKAGDEDVRLTWRQLESDYPLSPSQLSDGSLRFICLVTALLQPNPPSTIIFDEPELGLHPYAIALLGALVRVASTTTQVIISTQSVPLLNEFTLNDIIIVERKKGVSVFRRVQEADFSGWLEDYSIGELWEKNVLGGRP